MRVFFFDIDGTLVNTGGAGLAAIRSAFAAEFAITATADVQVSGRTDRGIASSLFQLYGIEDSTENWERFRAAYLRRLPDHLPLRQGRVLPGVVALLNRLAGQESVALGLLTGNVREGARAKLEYFGLHHYFAFGGFGDQRLDRNEVAVDALDAARRRIAGPMQPDRLWVIGDTPLDIRCARWIGARVAAVATGSYAREELAAEQPDLLLSDLTDEAGLLELFSPSR